MVYKDKIYGKFNIKEPVLIELIKSPAMQRLKKINQYGYIGSYLPQVKNNRFDHSMGVFCLLRKFGASLEEQIAGLLHDVSHSAFSHCIDYVLKGKDAHQQTHQDDVFEGYIKKTEIPKILKKHKIDLEYILDDKNFPLKENDLPDICADRIDYTLRDSFCFKEAKKDEIRYFLANLRVNNGQWFFENYQSAQKFAKLYFKMNRKYYSGLPTALMYRTVGDCLKYALDGKYISEKNLYTTDREVLEKVKKNLKKDEKLDILWKRMNKKIGYKFSKERDSLKVICKSRAIDELFQKDEKLTRISDVDKNWKKIVREESKPKEYFIKFEK
jgi:HD superfamily phosphohydrolase